MADQRVALLLAVYDQAFSGSSWHGTPLWGSLRGVSHRLAQQRPGKGRHSIWELVLHTAYWKYVVRRRLVRDAGIEFPRPGSNWPRLPARLDAAAWSRDRALLKREHLLLRRVIARLDRGHLGRRVPRSRWTTAQTVYGIASHDLYHAGQIQLLKKLGIGA